MIQVRLIHRQQRPGNYSIEGLFQYIKDQLKSKIDFEDYVVDNQKRRAALRSMRFLRDKINHITGDVYFLGLTLPPKSTIITVHDIGHFENTLIGIKKLIYKWVWLKWPLSKINYITCVSEFTKSRIVKQLGIVADKIQVIYNPLPGDFTFAPKTQKEHKPIVLQVGHAPNKNREGLISAAAGLNCKIVFIGPITGVQKKLLSDLKIDYENINFLNAKELREQYERSDILYFASHYEGFGLPIIEAQAVGRPVITSNRASMPEIAGEGALFVDPTSMGEIRSAIERILNNPDFADYLIKKGLENIKRFSSERILDQYYKLYSEVHTSMHQQLPLNT